jgi:hypothetical protein
MSTGSVRVVDEFISALSLLGVRSKARRDMKEGAKRFLSSEKE